MTMQQPKNRQLGAKGQTAVKLFFEVLDWGAVEVSEHDLGTDVIVQVRDTDLTDMSLSLGVQVKTGDSWFKEEAEVEGQPGWIFRESDAKHANYWSNNPLPHILVIQNGECTKRYWAFLNRETIQPTKGKGFTVFVPASQPLERSFRPVWIEATEKALKRMALEGSRWSFDVSSLPDSQRARYALLASRLVVPHPNKSGKASISWAEAVAICISVEAEKWERNADRHPEVPHVPDAAVNEEWGWRFAAAIYHWIYHADTKSLESLDSSGQVHQHQIAHAIATAVALVENGRIDEAAEYLKRFAVEAEFSVDQAWLSVHRSHLAMERGDIEEARRLAQLSYAQLAPVGADVTASSIRAASAWAIFDTAEMLTLDVGPVVSALDNPSSWWLTQTTSAGLGAAFKQHFRNWSHDKSVIFGATNIPENALHSSTVQAQLSGSFAQAENYTSLRAKIQLSIPSDRGGHPLSALDALRLAGDEKGLALAIAEIGRTGPLDDLRELVHRVRLVSMTRTSSRADLRVLQYAGIYAETQHARNLADFLLSALEDPQAFGGRISARYLVVPALLEALAGLQNFLHPEHWSRLVELLVTRPQDEVSAVSLLRLLDAATISDEDRDRFKSVFSEAPAWYQNVLLTAASTRTVGNREDVRRQLLAGNVGALASLQGRIDNLEQDEARAVSAALSSAVEADQGRQLTEVVIGSRDVASDLAMVIINFPDLDGWNALIHYFGDPVVATYRKREAALTISRNAHSVPASVRSRLRDAVTTARAQACESVLPLSFVPDAGGALDCLYLSLLDAADSRSGRILLSLLLGSKQQRRDAALYLGDSEGSELQLVPLIKDPDHEVSEIAAAGLARTVRRSADPNPDIVKLLTDLASENSALGLPIAVGLSGSDPLIRTLRPIVEALQSHTSVRVRQLAGDLASDEVS